MLVFSFLLGALLSISLKLPNRIKADIVSFSAGIFLSAVSFSILEESVKLGNIISTAIGFGLGALTFSIIRYILQKGDKIENFRDESKNNSRKNAGHVNSKSGGKLIIVGTLADSHPETLIIGIIVGLGLQDLLPTIIVLFLGNITATIDGTKK